MSNPRETLQTSGSSPRVRGKQVLGGRGQDRARLIPARAGKTPPTPLSPQPRRAHPRACGENRAADPTLTRTAGSSPRVRGKRILLPRRGPWARLIPARAGKTSPTRYGATSAAAHPRACGENEDPASRMAYIEGSSPRVRGKHDPAAPSAGPQGLIPARAGKTRACRRRSPAPSAHPRACGENL